MMNRFKTLICLALIFGTTTIIALGEPVSFYPVRSFALYATALIALYIFVFKLNGSKDFRPPQLGMNLNSVEPITAVQLKGLSPSTTNASSTVNKLSNSLIFIVITGMILRTLCFAYPLSDDVNRYAWEGMIQTQGVNPYITAPAKLGVEFRHDPIFAGINHKDVSTAYPPVAMLIFRAISSVSYSLIAYKLFFIICDSLVLILLALLIKQWKIPERNLALYAWNPLVILCGAGEGHLDVLHILFIVTALLLFAISSKKSAQAVNSKTTAPTRLCNNKFRFPTANECLITYCSNIGLFSALAFFMLGVAVMTKLLSIIILPFIITRRNVKWLPCFFVPFLTILLFWSPDMASGLMTFSGEMSYNDVIPKLLRYFLTGTAYKLAMLTIFASGMGLIWLMTQYNRLTGIFYTFLWCLFCLPCVHIWYLMPLALFIIAVPHRATFLLFITCGTGFWVLNYQLITGQWREFLWIWLATYLPVLLLIIKDHNANRLPWLERFAHPTSLDIIVPTYNEGKNIDNHLQSLQGAVTQLPASCTCQIIVVDGESTDDTRERVAHYNCQLRSSRRGRGNQIAAGLKAAYGDLTLILHADSTVDDQALKCLLDALIRKPTIGWGVLGHHYSADNNRMTLIRCLNSLRFSLFAIAFGDQGMFFRRQLLERQGGIPAMPLMEDIELSLRLSLFPRLRIGDLLTLSTRRWQRQSSVKHTFHVVFIVFIFLLTRRLGFDLSQRLYNIYYEKRSIKQ